MWLWREFFSVTETSGNGLLRYQQLVNAVLIHVKRLKKTFKYLGIFLLVLVLFRGFLYRTCVTYTKIESRSHVVLTDTALIKSIDKEIEGEKLQLSDIAELSNQLTRKKLSFTFTKISNDPNKVCELGKANCIGYSALFNSIGNYVVKKKGLSNRYELTHHVGTLNVFGFDVHSVFNNPFFKDHDFNEIRDKVSGEVLYVDPSMSDYLWIDSVHMK